MAAIGEDQRTPFLEQLADGLVGVLRRAVLCSPLGFTADGGLSASAELTGAGSTKAAASCLQMLHQFLNAAAYKTNL